MTKNRIKPGSLIYMVELSNIILRWNYNKKCLKLLVVCSNINVILISEMVSMMTHENKRNDDVTNYCAHLPDDGAGACGQ